MDMKLELVLLPVSDIDRAKSFYEKQFGFHLDVDHQPNDDFRVIQFTPPGSACSVTFGKGITEAEPGSVKGLHLVVTDIVAARDELVERGVEVGDTYHFGPEGRQPGPDPKHGRFTSYAEIRDPDGNMWLLQEVPAEPAT
jgi:catechol 2,3-dioxygenase-like lactoylglutathione lyase family enzyme